MLLPSMMTSWRTMLKPEARYKMNQMRVSRGYYPVVAMVQPEWSYGGSGAGKGKSKKGKGKPPKPPSAKAQGRAALGAIKCLRCGQAGHMAARCPAQSQNKRKADTDPDQEINMVVDLSDEEVNLFDDLDKSEPNDVAMFDSGAASLFIGTPQLKKLLKALSLKGCDLSTIPAWRCEKGMRFGNAGRDVTSLCVLVATYFKGKRRDILMYVLDVNSLSSCQLWRFLAPPSTIKQSRLPGAKDRSWSRRRWGQRESMLSIWQRTLTSSRRRKTPIRSSRRTTLTSMSSRRFP